MILRNLFGLLPIPSLLRQSLRNPGFFVVFQRGTSRLRWRARLRQFRIFFLAGSFRFPGEPGWLAPLKWLRKAPYVGQWCLSYFASPAVVYFITFSLLSQVQQIVSFFFSLYSFLGGRYPPLLRCSFCESGGRNSQLTVYVRKEEYRRPPLLAHNFSSQR